MSAPKSDPNPKNPRRAGTVEGADSDPDGPGIDPASGSPTPAKPGEPVAANHAVDPGPVHLDGSEQEIHPPQTADVPTAGGKARSQPSPNPPPTNPPKPPPPKPPTGKGK